MGIILNLYLKSGISFWLEGWMIPTNTIINLTKIFTKGRKYK